MGLTFAQRIAGIFALDEVAKAVQPSLHSAFERAPWARELLSGRALGAPLHPALTDVPLGAWVAAAVADLVDDGEQTAQACLAVGIAASLPAAAAGASDWSDLEGPARRIGTAHAIGNSAALLLNIASLALRRAGRHDAGRAASLAGLALAGVSAHLGGQLSFGLGVGVNRTAWHEGPGEFTAVIEEAKLADGALHRVEVAGVRVVVARLGDGRIGAIDAACSHLGGPLDEGERVGDTVRCWWHGSTFDLCTGAALSAPAVFPQPRYEARVRDGQVELRRVYVGKTRPDEPTA